MGDDGSKLFRIRKTVARMLHDRGYVVGTEDLEMTKDEFKTKYGDTPTRDSMLMIAPKVDDQEEQIYVFFPDEEKVGVKTIKNFAQRMKDDNVHRAIIVVQQNLTAFARQSLLETERSKYHIEQFNEQELLVNITEHTLVPKHQVLTDAEKTTLLDRYKVKDAQLPRIQMNDPVARYYGLRRGQVVRIIRPSETAGRYVTYRLCV